MAKESTENAATAEAKQAKPGRDGGKPQQGKKGEGKGKDKGAKAKAPEKQQEPARPRVPPRMRERYRKEIVPAMMKEFNYVSHMAVPRIEKVTLNMGLGEAVANSNVIKNAAEEISTIAGQKAVVTRAKKSIANFKLRAGVPIGAMVTLRRERMWEFLDRLITIAMPRIRDFKGVSGKAFDGRGNYSMGLREQTIFPEINYDKVEKVRGMNVTITTSARTDEEGKALLKHLGMPFRN
jgi:large subunit ribosomal protein L5